MNAAFQWNSAINGGLIEDFIHEMTTDRPLLMRDVLKIGMGDLRSWTDTGVIVGATCGCLIGTCAIAAARADRNAVAFQRSENNNYIDVAPMTLAQAVAGGNVDVAERFSDVGIRVSEECDGDPELGDDDYDERHDAVRAYISDLIAVDLRLLGLRVPRIKALV